MAESLLGALALLVFGVFWLSTQPWFDLLPRRVTRRIGYGGLVILTGAAFLAPTALQAGLERWMDYATAKAQERYTDFIDGAFDHLYTPQPPTPAPAPSQ
jgi:hypothetical protein